MRKDIIVGERYEILRGEEVIPTFIGPMQRELFKFEELFDEKLTSFLEHIYTDIIAKSTAYEAFEVNMQDPWRLVSTNLKKKIRREAKIRERDA